MRVYFICTYRTPSSSRMVPIKYGLSVLLSFCPSFCLSRCFLELDILFNFVMVLKTIIKLCVTGLDILEKLFSPQKMGEIDQEKVFYLQTVLVINFHRICSIIKIYYLLRSLNPMFQNNLVSEIKAKVLSANQIGRFSNQLFLQNESMKQSKVVVANVVSELWNWLYIKNEWLELTDFFQAGINPCK